jgi:hypothetical protein
MAMLQNAGAKRRARIRTASPFDGMIDEIVEALLEIGGSAHRDTVIERVAVRRGADRVPDGLARDLVEAFDLHSASGEGPARLHLPFGEGSRRWALTSDALQLGDDRQRYGMAPTGELAASLAAASIG